MRQGPMGACGLYPALKVGQASCTGREVGQANGLWRGRAGGYIVLLVLVYADESLLSPT